jgi:hypothetical protein
MAKNTRSQHIHDSRRVLRMISELHVRGYQRLRIIPHLYSLGTWRCGITFKENVRSDHGALPCDWDFANTPQYTSADGRECFGWPDAERATQTQLAELFLKRFPEVSRRGFGSDWEYAGWFSWMLHETYPDCLPIAEANTLPSRLAVW